MSLYLSDYTSRRRKLIKLTKLIKLKTSQPKIIFTFAIWYGE